MKPCNGVFHVSLSPSHYLSWYTTRLCVCVCVCVFARACVCFSLARALLCMRRAISFLYTPNSVLKGGMRYQNAVPPRAPWKNGIPSSWEYGSDILVYVCIDSRCSKFRGRNCLLLQSDAVCGMACRACTWQQLVGLVSSANVSCRSSSTPALELREEAASQHTPGICIK